MESHDFIFLILQTHDSATDYCTNNSAEIYVFCPLQNDTGYYNHQVFFFLKAIPKGHDYSMSQEHD